MKKRWLLVLGAVVLLASPVWAEETEGGSAAETEAAAAAETESEAADENESQLSNDEMMGLVLDALGDEQYRKTYEYLKGGETFSEGYRGEAGMGLQKMLVDFGCGITIDGAVGAKTMEALHQVESAFGLETTDQADLALYEKLLPLVLLTREDTTAETGFGEEAETESEAESKAETDAAAKQISDLELEEYYNEAGGDGYFDYLKACILAAQGKYYSAKEAFEACSYEGSEERAQSCVQPFPESGEIWRNPDIPGSDSSLTFIVNSSDDSQGMCFKLFDMDDRVVSVVYVRGNSSATTYVPTGTYHMMDGTGDEWYGSSETFGPYGYYEYLTFSEDPDTMYDAWLDYGSYELAINVSEIEEGATSVGSSSVGWNESVGFSS